MKPFKYPISSLPHLHPKEQPVSDLSTHAPHSRLIPIVTSPRPWQLAHIIFPSSILSQVIPSKSAILPPQSGSPLAIPSYSRQNSQPPNPKSQGDKQYVKGRKVETNPLSPPQQRQRSVRITCCLSDCVSVTSVTGPNLELGEV